MNESISNHFLPDLSPFQARRVLLTFQLVWGVRPVPYIDPTDRLGVQERIKLSFVLRQVGRAQKMSSHSSQFPELIDPISRRR